MKKTSHKQINIIKPALRNTVKPRFLTSKDNYFRIPCSPQQGQLNVQRMTIRNGMRLTSERYKALTDTKYKY